MGLELSLESVAALDQRTEGWIAGLHPAHEERVARLAEEAADVHAPEREAREPEREAAPDLGPEVVPVRGAVAAPVSYNFV